MNTKPGTYPAASHRLSYWAKWLKIEDDDYLLYVADLPAGRGEEPEMRAAA